MFRNFIDLLKYPFRKWFLWCLLIINILGSIYGYYWYRYQLAETPWKYILFVPDSPLSSTLFCLALIMIIINRRSGFLELFAYLWVIKYGIWAVVININAGYILGEFSFENWLLTLSHFGMAMEGVIFLRHLAIKQIHIAVLTVWMGINDFMDYVVGLYPYLFDPSQYSLARFSALLLSLVLILSSIVLYSRKKLNSSIY